MFFAMMTTQAFCHTDTQGLTDTQAAVAQLNQDTDDTNVQGVFGEAAFLPVDRDWDDRWDDDDDDWDDRFDRDDDDDDDWWDD